MRPYHFKTLRARLTALLILPVVLILLVAGFSGFIYARDLMLDQWNETVILQLRLQSKRSRCGCCVRWN